MSREPKLNIKAVPLAAVILLFLSAVLILFTQGLTLNKTSESKPLPKPTAEKICKNDQSYTCFKNAIVADLKSLGIKSTLSELDSLNNSNATVRQYCHSLVHDLGREAYEQTAGNLGKIFTEGTTTCWSGFYHGALERAFGKTTDLAKTAQGICTSENGVSGTFLNYQCLHGLGHGLSARFDNEIFSALAVCEQLDSEYSQKSCYGGVFMENYVADGINHQIRYVSAEDPIAPCNKVSEKFKYNCYQLVSIQILRLNSYNFEDAFKTCEKSDLNYINVCYQSVGRDVAGYVAEDWDRAVQYCALGNSEAQRACIASVSTDSVYSRASGKNAKVFCQKVKLELKKNCYEAAGQSLAVVFSDKKKRIEACESYERDYVKFCKQAASVS
jgi:hypothetical protein